ncbi:MAG: DUF1924 domain-containing protein [Epsilonproteobacteria bacterium]|nr:DUF1924 domain-containing protein [Campylobacterota bacterium]
MKKLLLLIGITTFAFSNEVIDKYLKELEAQVKAQEPDFKGFSAKRGKEIFFSTHIGKRGKEISCASCHTKDLTKPGENIFTGKKIEPLSPKVNPKRLTDLKKVKKWLRRNFKDVYKRDGTPKEKGDVLMFILEN